MRAALLALLLTAPLLAGCAAPPPPGPGNGTALPPTPPPSGPPSGGNGTAPNATLLADAPLRISIEGAANEVSIAIDARDPQRLLVGAKDYSLGAKGACGASNVWAGVWTSHDGGRAWGHHLLPGFPGDTTANALSAYRCISDPFVLFGPQGDAWYAGLAFGSANGSALPVPAPPPALPGEVTTEAAAVFLAHSGDGGATWDRFTLPTGGQPATGNAMATRPTLVVGDDGTLYMGWSRAAPRPDVPAQAIVVHSTDGGATWGVPVPLLAEPPLVAGEPPALALTANGSLLAVWTAAAQGGSGATMYSSLSLDGGQTWLSRTPIAPVAQPPSPLPNAQFRVANFPQLAIDRSDGPRKGWAYAAWADAGGGDSDVVVAVSHDGGLTWGEPASIHGPGARNEQVMPALTVTASGDVDVLFYDRRADPAGKLVQAWFADSHDGGATWNETALPQAPFDGDLSLHQSGAPFLGDYVGIARAARGSWAAWTATTFGRGDLFVMPV